MAQKDFLYSRLEDAAEKAVRWDQAVYGDFYEENLQHGIEREIGRYPEADCAFFGGQEYSRRKMLSVFPKGEEPDIRSYPLELIFISVRGDVSHRDYLGALLGLGIEREKVGDIDVMTGGAQVFVSAPLGRFIEENLTGVSRYDAQTKVKDLSEAVEIPPVFEKITIIIPSLRVDAVIHGVYKLSRSEASAFVKGEKVFVNGDAKVKPGYDLKTGDIVSVRSKGKFIVDEISGQTKKGNIKLSVRKYA